MRSQRILVSAVVLFVAIAGVLSPATAQEWYVQDTGELGWWGQSGALPNPDYWEPMDEVAPTGTPSTAPLWPEGYEYHPLYTGVSLHGSYGGKYVDAIIRWSNPHPTEEVRLTVELWRYADQATPIELFGTSVRRLPPGILDAAPIFGWRLDPGIADFDGELLVLKIIYDGPQENGALIHWDGSSLQPTRMRAYDAPEGLNPHVRAYIDFSPPDYLHHVSPETYDVVDAYVVLDCFGDTGPEGGGMLLISLAIDVTPGTSLVTSYESLLPGGLGIGDWETGMSLSSTECVPPDGSAPDNNGVVLVARITMVYSGIPGDIVIEDDPWFPRWLIGCETDENRFRVLSNGGLGQPPSTPGDPGAEQCFASTTTIERTSWGAIKALFR